MLRASVYVHGLFVCLLGAPASECNVMRTLIDMTLYATCLCMCLYGRQLPNNMVQSFQT